MGLSQIRTFFAPSRPIKNDWRAKLSEEGERIFASITGGWNVTHAMLSVALNDALNLRTTGELICAQQQARVAAKLVERLVEHLGAACEVFRDEGKSIAALPRVEPLNLSFFRSETARRMARWNAVLHPILPSSRGRYFRKLHLLGNTLARLCEEFRESAEEIAEGMATQPTARWSALESLQYDLTTCLCETQVLLKSFLHSLPVPQAETLESRLEKRVTRLRRVAAGPRELFSILPNQFR